MISVVIPVYNEEKIIAESTKQLCETLGCDFGSDWELILVNDGSTDSTPEIIGSLAGGNVRAEGYRKNRGKGSAVRTGVLAAKGDVVLYTDADLAYGTDIIKSFYGALRGKEHSAAIGSRTLGGSGYAAYTFIRRLASKTYLLILRVFAGFRYSDSQCGIKAFTADDAKKIFSNVATDGFAFDLEALMLARKVGTEVKEIPVKIINHRESKINPVRDAFRMLADVVRIKRRVRKVNI